MRAAIFVALLSLAVASQTTPQPLTVTVDARSIHQGELVVYTVHTAQPTDDLKARAFGHLVATYRIDGVTWKVLAGIDLETAPGSYPVIINATMASGRVETTQTLLVRTKAFPTRTLAVDDAFVNPPASETERIAAEGARLTKLWATTTPEKLWEGAFVRPVSEAANSAFGSRSVFNGQARSPSSSTTASASIPCLRTSPRSRSRKATSSPQDRSSARWVRQDA